MVLVLEVGDDDSVDVQHRWEIGFFGMFEVVGEMGEKEKEFQRLCDVIVPYITKNLQPYITRPPIQSRGDWGQSQFQLGGDDESTHQILSNGLLFSTFYHFLYTADPPTSTTPMRPSATFTHPPPTIPYTHCTISLVPCRRPSI